MVVATDVEFAAGSKTPGIDLLNARHERFVNSVYTAVDEAAGRELNRLYVKEGITPTCGPGCFYCCGQYILTNIAEAQALAHYIQREFSSGQIHALKIRTRQWHQWDAIRPCRPPAIRIDAPFTFPDYLYCPMLVKGQCSAYPMRPLICRTHFVCSDPPACRPSHDPESIEDTPAALASVITATIPYSAMMKDRIENEGFDFRGSIMLLPHWLAIEMKWEFAISPQFG
jgi:Fe-S-cluster containining protein